MSADKPTGRAGLVPAGRLLRGPRPGLLRLQRRRLRRPARTDAELDYLQWLGVDCLWLPPFYDSPRRDGGYDIRDYYAIAPEYGTLDDFVTLLDEAHARGIRVITDLVLNHTSDTHRWFQESRARPRRARTATTTSGATPTPSTPASGSSSPTPSRPTGRSTRSGSSSTGTGSSTTSPTSTTTTRPSQEAMLDVVRFWLDLGIDGFRLDAVTYLFEREGTDCAEPARDARVPQAHPRDRRRRVPRPGAARRGEPVADGTRRLLRRRRDRRRRVPHGVPLPADAAHLHGGPPGVPYPDLGHHGADPGDPAGCQWGTFLRNHDELTLEMVTGEERDYIYAEYAEDPRMRLNLGIRRRLAPLLGNDRDQIELFTSLLLSLPGSPVLYYGDEIGMGDNVWLGDRDGVRTPMQWSRRPQRRLLPVRPEPAVPAGQQRLGLRLPGRQRRAPDRPARLAAAVDPPDARRPQAVPGVRPRRPSTDLHGHQPGGAGVPAEYTDDEARRDRAVRAQPVPASAAGAADRSAAASTVNVPVELTGGTRSRPSACGPTC